MLKGGPCHPAIVDLFVSFDLQPTWQWLAGLDYSLPLKPVANLILRVAAASRQVPLIARRCPPHTRWRHAVAPAQPCPQRSHLRWIRRTTRHADGSGCGFRLANAFTHRRWGRLD